jgi:hypothetical protein
MRSPYSGLPQYAFWHAGVANQKPETITDLYRPKFAITPVKRVATAGSCFAQHIARSMRARDFSVIDVEPPPVGLDTTSTAEFGYGLYSARYGNIYTSRQPLQLFREAEDEFHPADPIWKKGERYYDAMRPSVEPDGLSTSHSFRKTLGPSRHRACRRP